MATPSPPLPSALTTLQATTPLPSTHPPHLHSLALQILHNLRHQHDWTALQIHTHSPLPTSDPTAPLLPRPLLSGLPPSRIYIHPDEQLELLKAGTASKDLAAEPEREWVLPTHVREKWSLRRFAECFDGVGEVPPAMKESEGEEKEGVKGGERRGGKRMLLATVGDDSTVVYYIVHEGIVKPRQN